MSLKNVKEFLKKEGIDYFIQPNNDDFFSEYLPDYAKRLEFITNFSGSNAVVIFTVDKSYFFTDGRYTLQAAQQIDLKEFEIIDLSDISLLKWLEYNLKNNSTLAFDANLLSAIFVKSLKGLINKKSAKLKALDYNIIDQFWIKRPEKETSRPFLCDNNFITYDSIIKREQICCKLKADSILITKPENICWLLNIRASDIRYTPILLSRGILYKDGKFDLFIDDINPFNLLTKELPNVDFVNSKYFTKKILLLINQDKNIQTDLKTINYYLYNKLQKSNIEIIDQVDPIDLAKSIKDKNEILGFINAHKIDGLAVTKFLFWLDQSIENNVAIDELQASQKILELRKRNKDFLYPSFATISSFASNGAIIHYQPSQNSNKKIEGNSLFLIDSGGQYCGDDSLGTTDVTRTIAVGKVNSEMIANFTRVLKGHIALARAKFLIGTNGAQLDILARYHLWQANLNYNHGTGHGVGSFFSVHEGPCGIGKNYQQQLIPGMIISNEPGYYKENEYGIRIENLMLVKKYNEQFLYFETLTLAPIDQRLIDFSMLTYPEKKWLKDYHQKVYNTHEEYMTKHEKDWYNRKFNL